MSQSVSDENIPERERQEAESPETTQQLRARAEALLSEPQIPTQSIFKDIFSAGGKNEEELRYELFAFGTSMAWVDYWASEGFLTEVVSSTGRRFVLSHRAILELELA